MPVEERIPRLRIGRYRLVRLIGAGAYGEVFEASHVTLGSKVAIKIMRRRDRNEEEWASVVKRFHKEASVAATLDSSHVVKVLDYGTVTAEHIIPDEEGRYPEWELREYVGALFLVMEYVEGRTLREWIREHPNGMPLSLVDAFVQQIAAGLEVIHRAGAVHRDLKPANIMVQEEEGILEASYSLKILDFGMVKLLDMEAPASTQGFKGTPMYAANEQLYDRTVGPYTDVYSLAVITYEMLAGHPPFVLPWSEDDEDSGTPYLKDSEGRPRFKLPSTMKLLNMKINNEYMPLIQSRPGLPTSVYRVVEKGMSRDPSARPASASEFAASLHEALVRGESLVQRAWGWLLLHRKLMPVLAVIPVLLALGGAYLAWSWWQAPEDVLVVLTRHPPEVQEEFARAFARWMERRYGKRVRVVWATASSTSSIVSDIRRSKGKPRYDVLFGGGEAPYILLSRKGCTRDWLTKQEVPCLASYTPRYLPSIFGRKFYDSGHHWFGAAVSTFGIFCDSRSLKGRKVPSSWADLMAVRPVALADPSRSGVMHMIVEILLQSRGWKDGWALWAALLARAVVATDSWKSLKAVVDGHAACAPTIDFYAFERMVKDRERWIFVIPRGETIVNSDPVAILRGASHPRLAELFVEFVLSKEGQSLWWLAKGTPNGPVKYTLARLPVRPDVYFSGSEKAIHIDPTDIKTMKFNTVLVAERWRVVDAIASFLLAHRKELANRRFTIPISEKDAAAMAEGMRNDPRGTMERIGRRLSVALEDGASSP